MEYAGLTDSIGKLLPMPEVLVAQGMTPELQEDGTYRFATDLLPTDDQAGVLFLTCMSAQVFALTLIADFGHGMEAPLWSSSGSVVSVALPVAVAGLKVQGSQVVPATVYLSLGWSP